MVIPPSSLVLWEATEAVISATDPDSDSVVVGQPVTRQIQIVAEGRTANQLPEIKLAESSKLKQYPDQETRETTDDGTIVKGTVKRNIAVIVSEAGQVKFPDIEIAWWNTQTNQQKIARLAGETLTVIADPASTPLPDSKETPVTQAETNLVEQHSSDPVTSDSTKIYWQLACILFLGGWIGSIFYYRTRLPNKDSYDVKESDPGDENMDRLYARLISACKENNAQKSRAYSLSWLRAAEKQNPTSFRDSSVEYKKLNNAIVELDEYLYKNVAQVGSTVWNGDDLATALDAIHQKRSSKADSDLPALYAS